MTRQKNVYKQAYNATLRMLRTGAELPSEPDLGAALGVSRTTVRSILSRLSECGLIAWNKRAKIVLRTPRPDDFFPRGETVSPNAMIERAFMRRLLDGGMAAGTQINELELARAVGVGTTSIREFLIAFSRFGLIEKQPNRHWVLKGFTEDFALELAEIREMFELRSAAAFLRIDRDNPVWTELDAIEQAHTALLADIDTRFADFSELDERFHRLIHEASRNRFIIDFYDVIAIVFHYHYQWNKADERIRNERAIGEHLDYIAALRAGDAVLVDRACRAHLASARRTLLESVAEPTPS